MKKSWFKMMFMVFLIISFAACATMESDWHKARQTDSAEAYRLFINKHPESSYVDEAIAQVRRIAWESASKSNTRKAYQKFLEDFPESSYQKAAESKIESLDWQTAQKEDSLMSYQTYIELYPEGIYREVAEERIEEHLWRQSQQTKTLESLQSYLRNYPDGKYQKQCQQKIEELIWSEATNPKIDLRKIEQYLGRFPQGKYVVQAKEIRDYYKAHTKGTPQAFKAYLTNFPNGRYHQMALRNIDLLSGRQKKELSIVLSDSAEAIFTLLYKAMNKQTFGKILVTKQYPFVVQIKDDLKGDFQNMTFKYKNKEFDIHAKVQSSLTMITAKTAHNKTATETARQMNKSAPSNTTFAVAIEPVFNIESGGMSFAGVITSSGYHVKPVSGKIYADQMDLKVKIKENSIFEIDGAKFEFQKGQFNHVAGLFQ